LTLSRVDMLDLW